MTTLLRIVVFGAVVALGLTGCDAFDIEDRPVEWRIASGNAEGFRYRSEIN